MYHRLEDTPISNHVSHAALPYPIKGCRYTILVPYLDADGDPTDPTTPDTERSIDGNSFSDCTEEVSTITGSNGMGYITLTGDELNGSLIAVAAKVTSGPKATLAMLTPRVLPIILSGTAAGGAAGTITLPAGGVSIDDFYNGCIVRTTGGTGGGGGSGSLGNQARVITDYVGSTKVASIAPNWETNPSTDTTFEILLTEFAWFRLTNVLQVGGAAQTARDLGASVLLAPGTGTGQVDITSGVIKANLAQILGTVLTETGGQIAAAFKQFFDIASPTGTMKAISLVEALGTQAKADVNAEVVDALNLATYAEPGQETPPATTTLVKKIGYLYKAFRNRKTQTSTTLSLYADDALTVDQKATVSDDGSTFDHGEIGIGP